MLGARALISMAGLKIKKYSPEILMVTGVISFVGTVVVACKQTTKASEILEDHRIGMDEIKEAEELSDKGELVNKDGKVIVYDKETVKHDKLNVWAHTFVGFGKLYLPAITLGTISIVSFLAANRILKARYLAAVTAFNAVSEAFDSYRKRVIDERGEMYDRHFMYGSEFEVEDVVDPEDGSVKHEVIEKVKIENNNSPYARFFDPSCEDWDENPSLNMIFLTAQQQTAQRMLEKKGNLFLNEVYDLLGFERTTVGALVGWIYDPQNPNGDNYVDFGLWNQDSVATRRFVNNVENVVLLDFNVDGVIYDKI